MYVKEFIECLELRPLISVHHIDYPKCHYRIAFDEDIPVDIYEGSVRVSTVLKNPNLWVVNTQDEITHHVVYAAISLFSFVKKSIGIWGLRYTLIELNTNREFANANSKEKLVLTVLDKLRKKEIPLRCKS